MEDVTGGETVDVAVMLSKGKAAWSTESTELEFECTFESVFTLLVEESFCGRAWKAVDDKVDDGVSDVEEMEEEKEEKESESAPASPRVEREGM